MSGTGCGSQLPPRHIFSASSGLLAFITGQGGLLAQYHLGRGGSHQFHPVWPSIDPPSHNTFLTPIPHSAGQLSVGSFRGSKSGRLSEGRVPVFLPATTGMGPIRAPPLPEREPPTQAVSPWRSSVLGEVPACSMPRGLWLPSA